MSRRSDEELRKKIEAYEYRLIQRLYEGNLHAVIEAFYGIWFLSWVIGEHGPQPEILKRHTHRWIPFKEYVETIKYNHGAN